MNTDKWTTQLENLTEAFEQHFSSLTEEQLNWKPSEQTWSIAQNIDHLIVINKSYYPVIQSIKQGTYKLPLLGRFNFMVNFLGKTILNSVQPDRKRKVKTVPMWEPKKSLITADIVTRFAQHQQELKQIIQSTEDLLDKPTVISSPANKNIVYRLDTAFDIIVSHEQRHLEQAKEVLAKMTKQYQA